MDFNAVDGQADSSIAEALRSGSHGRVGDPPYESQKEVFPCH